MEEKKLQYIANKQVLLSDISDNDLVEFCTTANDLYRRGNPLISDSDYDFVFLAELQRRLPHHPFLQKIEAENNSFGEQKLKLPQIMLSTDKAFSLPEIEKWIERIAKASGKKNIHDILIKATPKLDGFAAFDDGKTLYTRGDGKKGSDITRVFERGLQIFENGKRGLGAGEIVVKKSYFYDFLSNDFEHSRNFQASIIREKELDKFGKHAIEQGAAMFVPFVLLPRVTLTTRDLLQKFNQIVAEVLTSVDFDVDGVIFEVVDNDIKEEMGANRKFHRWMIAFKENKEKAQVEVQKVVPQVGRTGKVTPVAHLVPTKLSGAVISHASCYHYNFVKQNELGAGSVVELIRSGLVIPKIVQVLQKTTADIPKNCPSCETELQWQSDFLVCTNHTNCQAQNLACIEYFFAILANNDGFGSATIEKLFNHDITSITAIYALEIEQLTAMGFGEKTAQNLVSELEKSRTTEIEDYRFLAAFGVERLGLGNSENLLRRYSISEIFTVNAEDIAAIEGFAEITARAIVKGLQSIQAEFEWLYGLGFTLEKTAIHQMSETHYFTGKKLVFSGKMQHSRTDMEKNAKQLGAIIQKSVSSKTDYLIIGEKVGQSKLDKATTLGVEILSEEEYLKQL